MFGLQPIHLVLILIIALFIFGPQRLPELTRGFGQSIREFKQATKETRQEITEVVAPIKDVSAGLTGTAGKRE